MPARPVDPYPGPPRVSLPPTEDRPSGRCTETHPTRSRPASRHPQPRASHPPPRRQDHQTRDQYHRSPPRDGLNNKVRCRPITVIPEGAGPVNPLFLLGDLFFCCSPPALGRAGMRRRGQGSARKGRPRSGRRSLTPTPDGARCSGRRRRVGAAPWGRVLVVGCMLQCRCPGCGQAPHGGCRSSLRLWHGVLRQVRGGRGQSEGATTPCPGVMTATTRAHPRFGGCSRRRGVRGRGQAADVSVA